MSDLPPGSVTLSDLYAAINALRGEIAIALARLGVIESRNGDADSIHGDHEARLRVLERAVPAGLETRITALERMAWKLVGAFATVNALAVIVEWLIWSKK